MSLSMAIVELSYVMICDLPFGFLPQGSFDKSEDPIHVVNVCIKRTDMSDADQERQMIKFQEILQSRVCL